MLWSGTDATGLNPTNICNTQLARQVRILAESFKVPPTKRVPMDTNCRRKQGRSRLRFALVLVSPLYMNSLAE
jgi:hypothetical protein